ncbi:hypothetical protein UlMin_012910 [Ulmus minor]
MFLAIVLDPRYKIGYVKYSLSFFNDAQTVASDWLILLQLLLFEVFDFGTISFLLGLFFLFVWWTVVGIILEIYGCIVLFGGFWSSMKLFLNQIPYVGWIINYLFWVRLAR